MSTHTPPSSSRHNDHALEDEEKEKSGGGKELANIWERNKEREEDSKEWRKKKEERPLNFAARTKEKEEEETPFVRLSFCRFPFLCNLPSSLNCTAERFAILEPLNSSINVFELYEIRRPMNI